MERLVGERFSGIVIVPPEIIEKFNFVKK